VSSKALPLLAVCLFAVGCSTPTTYEQRLATVVPVFVRQIDSAANKIEIVKSDYLRANLSADATHLLDLMAADLSGDILKARFQLAEAQAQLDHENFVAASASITDLHAELSEFEMLATFRRD
jgi:hypothetical protein